MSATADNLTAPLPRSLVRPRIVYGRRGRLPAIDGEREYRCSCGKFQIRGYMPPGSKVEGWCPRCHESVVFET